MDKQADAFRTISEAADALGLPQHVLRFWETRFPQIKPLKRGGGRRYYRPDDVHLLSAIQRLLYNDGYTIKGVQRILKEQGAKAVIALGQNGPEGGNPAPAGPQLVGRMHPDILDDDDTEQDEPAGYPRALEAPPARRPSPSGASAQDLRALLTVIDGCINLLETAEA
ncbi:MULTISPECIES: MerR family transcriptional regulator [unclassified Beijerinckia]|uniref:MerR family transcriptional regulator n=1 Tax=unclassified Beijerinckia TaxID=2638183 RepID=UPI00089752A6|nr:MULTISPECIES: MerR family transcriptional regulator [unclassified Beijerinckia]MDH7794730.1 DNA-binding transcriptional MerR regulator [Beijerinckia sp. GAS462]SEB72940.1 MerR HTH family regulatory protein [Beijerinckia sp. 28-YEA-48]